MNKWTDELISEFKVLVSGYKFKIQISIYIWGWKDNRKGENFRESFMVESGHLLSSFKP